MCPAPDTEQGLGSISFGFSTQDWSMCSCLIVNPGVRGQLHPPLQAVRVLLPSSVGASHFSGILFYTSEEKFALVCFPLIFWSGWTFYYWKNILLPAIFPLLKAEKMMPSALGMTDVWAAGGCLTGSCSQLTAWEGHESFTACSTSCSYWIQKIWGTRAWLAMCCGSYICVA